MPPHVGVLLLCVAAGKIKSAIEIYVAMSRCREAQCCLLTERFDKALFQSGPLRPANTVLLARLRGDDDAFRELLTKYTAEAEARKQAAATQQRAAAGRNREGQAARGAKNSPDSQARKGRIGGLANTRKKQGTKGRTGGLGNDTATRAKGCTPKKGHAPKRKCADPEVQAGAPLPSHVADSIRCTTIPRLQVPEDSTERALYEECKACGVAPRSPLWLCQPLSIGALIRIVYPTCVLCFTGSVHPARCTWLRSRAPNRRSKQNIRRRGPTQTP